MHNKAIIQNDERGNNAGVFRHSWEKERETERNSKTPAGPVWFFFLFFPQVRLISKAPVTHFLLLL